MLKLESKFPDHVCSQEWKELALRGEAEVADATACEEIYVTTEGAAAATGSCAERPVETFA